jgi:hypothetical protein
MHKLEEKQGEILRVAQNDKQGRLQQPAQLADVELGGGGLISTREIPLGEPTFNFIPTGAIGVSILRGKYHCIDFRYLHISDAEITRFNPGTDVFGLREYISAR